MKERNKTVNVITAIVAVLLSILLVPTLFATGLVAAANSATSPAVMGNLITNTVQNIDFEQLILDSVEDSDISEEVLKEARTVTALLDSKAAKEFFSMYARDVAATLNGSYDPANASVSVQSVTDLANNHVDELVDALVALEPDADREEIRSAILTFVEENAGELLDSLKIENIVDMDGLTEITNALNLLKKVTWVLLGVCLVLAGLIYACRYYRFGGFIWLGVDFGISAVMMTLTALAVKSPLLTDLLGGEDTATLWLGGVTGAVGGMLTTVALILFGLTAVCIGVFILLKYKVLNKRDGATEIPAQEVPVEAAPSEEAAL